MIPPTLMRGKTIDFILKSDSDEFVVYLTDGTYMLVDGAYLEFEYVEEEMGS